jgi:hypothetical protein
MISRKKRKTRKKKANNLMNIAVLMWCDGKTSKRYGNTSYHINKIYCDKHGYDLIFSSERRHDRDDLAWEKVPMVIEHIKQYDYVIWIDADAHFYIDRGPIEDVIKEHPSSHFIFSEDCSPLSPEFMADGCLSINTGLFIVKNTPESEEILNKWAYDNDLFNLRLSGWDQGVANKMYVTNTCRLRDQSVILPFNVLQNFEKETKHDPYIRHLAGNTKRIHGIKKTFRGYLKQLI